MEASRWISSSTRSIRLRFSSVVTRRKSCLRWSISAGEGVPAAFATAFQISSPFSCMADFELGALADQLGPDPHVIAGHLEGPLALEALGPLLQAGREQLLLQVVLELEHLDLGAEPRDPGMELRSIGPRLVGRSGYGIVGRCRPRGRPVRSLAGPGRA